VRTEATREPNPKAYTFIEYLRMQSDGAYGSIRLAEKTLTLVQTLTFAVFILLEVRKAMIHSPLLIYPLFSNVTRTLTLMQSLLKRREDMRLQYAGKLQENRECRLIVVKSVRTSVLQTPYLMTAPWNLNSHQRMLLAALFPLNK
jgi:hypothetical protein